MEESRWFNVFLEFLLCKITVIVATNPVIPPIETQKTGVPRKEEPGDGLHRHGGGCDGGVGGPAG
jgi:hypothetical protein